MKKYTIFDAQINFGKNVFGPHSCLDYYLDHVPNSTSKALVIPTATHLRTLEKETVEISTYWKYKHKLIFYKVIENLRNHQHKIVYNPGSPYLAMNQFVLNKIREKNKGQNKIKFYFCPKFHPHLDKREDIEPFLYEKETVAVKIQGIASFSTPHDVPTWLIALLRAKNIPLFIHSSFYYANEVDPLRDPYMHYICLQNQPINWIMFGLKNDLRIFLAHGLRLCPYAANLVNKYANFLVGLGPSKMLNNERQHLYIQDQDFLDCLFTLIDARKIAYCSDFAWNVSDRGAWSAFDWHADLDVANTLRHHHLISHMHDVFTINAEKFFGIY